MMYHRLAACSLVLALAAAPLQVNAHPVSFNLNGMDSSATVKVHCYYESHEYYERHCWYSRRGSHYRRDSYGGPWRPRRCDWDPDWGWHDCGRHSRRWSHNRWGSYHSYGRDGWDGRYGSDD